MVWTPRSDVGNIFGMNSHGRAKTPPVRYLDVARFEAGIDKSAGPDGCWQWLKCIVPTGYGQQAIRRKPYTTHRIAWALWRGPIPSKLHVCHTCDNRACVNPRHLFLGTHADNMRDMYRKSRRKAARGEQASKAKLTASQVLAIRKDPRTLRAIGADYGVCHSNILAIKQRKHWAHL